MKAGTCICNTDLFTWNVTSTESTIVHCGYPKKNTTHKLDQRISGCSFIYPGNSRSIITVYDDFLVQEVIAPSKHSQENSNTFFNIYVFRCTKWSVQGPVYMKVYESSVHCKSLHPLQRRHPFEGRRYGGDPVFDTSH